MSWVVAGVAGGTAVLGALNAANQRKAQQRQNQQSADVSAAQTQFSPWTHIQPQGFQPQAITANPMSGAVQGGLGGAMFGMQLKKGMAEDEAAKALAAKTAAEEERKKQLMGFNPNQV